MILVRRCDFSDDDLIAFQQVTDCTAISLEIPAVTHPKLGYPDQNICGWVAYIDQQKSCVSGRDSTPERSNIPEFHLLTSVSAILVATASYQLPVQKHPAMMGAGSTTTGRHRLSLRERTNG
ncbi:hypothetical protein AB833_20075 [Chromatiales bacterium (ex Bugula neritina AB1)]|nr:hypothetical protein AB833_20075 [Chromatiales bacterium (ex Bugula neritina AB1)]